MRVIFHARSDYPGRRKHLQSTRLAAGEIPLVTTSRLEALAETLLRTWDGDTVMVVLINDHDELAALLRWRELLQGLSLLLVLPDDREDTVRGGHLLRPRFITFAGNDFGEVIAVLRRILARFRTAGPTADRRIKIVSAV